MNELIPTEELGISVPSKEVFDEVATSSEWLPRVQLYGSNSDLVKKNKFPMAHYGLVMSKDDINDLGDEVVLLVINWRPKAMEISDDGITSVFDTSDPDFVRIKGEAATPNSGCMFGPEFLVYIPSVKKFATFFMSSKSARREAQNLLDLIGKAALLRVKLIETKQWTWHAPSVVPSSSQFELPPIEEIKTHVDNFRNAEKQIADTSFEVESDRTR